MQRFQQNFLVEVLIDGNKSYNWLHGEFHAGGVTGSKTQKSSFSSEASHWAVFQTSQLNKNSSENQKAFSRLKLTKKAFIFYEEKNYGGWNNAKISTE